MRKPASTRVFQVWGPQTPSTRRPRRRWKASRAARVVGPKTPSASTGAPGRMAVQAVLHVGDRVAAVPDGERQAYR